MSYSGEFWDYASEPVRGRPHFLVPWVHSPWVTSTKSPNTIGASGERGDLHRDPRNSS